MSFLLVLISSFKHFLQDFLFSYLIQLFLSRDDNSIFSSLSKKYFLCSLRLFSNNSYTWKSININIKRFLTKHEENKDSKDFHPSKRDACKSIDDLVPLPQYPGNNGDAGGGGSAIRINEAGWLETSFPRGNWRAAYGPVSRRMPHSASSASRVCIATRMYTRRRSRKCGPPPPASAGIRRAITSYRCNDPENKYLPD